MLCWLESDPCRFKPYVGNRVISINSNISPSKWRHVSGQENPADCESRGLFPSELLQHKLWWNGPDWLQLDPSHWPPPPASTQMLYLKRKFNLVWSHVWNPKQHSYRLTAILLSPGFNVSQHGFCVSLIIAVIIQTSAPTSNPIL